MEHFTKLFEVRKKPENTYEYIKYILDFEEVMKILESKDPKTILSILEEKINEEIIEYLSLK